LAHLRRTRPVAVRARRTVRPRDPGAARRPGRPGAPPAPASEPRSMNAAPAPAPATNEPILYLDGVTVTFDGFRALDELSLVVEQGELRTIIGPNGAGKTTMMDVITGKTRPDTGTVRFKQRDLTRLDEAAIANLGIGRKFQKPTVFDALSVFENLELALKAERGPFASLRFKLAGPQRTRIDEVLDLVGLAERAGHLAGVLSHRQRHSL